MKNTSLVGECYKLSCFFFLAHFENMQVLPENTFYLNKPNWAEGL